MDIIYLDKNAKIEENGTKEEKILIIPETQTYLSLSNLFFRNVLTVDVNQIREIDSAFTEGEVRLIAQFSEDSEQRTSILFLRGELKYFKDPIDDASFPIPDYFELKVSDAEITRTGIFQYVFSDKNGKVQIPIVGKYSLVIPIDKDDSEADDNFETLIQVHYPDSEYFVTRYKQRGEILTDLMTVEIIEGKENITCKFTDRNTLQIGLDGEQYDIHFRLARNNVLNLPIKCNDDKKIILCINSLYYMIWRDKKGWHITVSSFGAPAWFKIIELFSSFILLGVIHNFSRQLLDVYLHDAACNIHLGRVHRIGNFYFARFPKNRLLLGKRIHSPIEFSDADGNYDKIKLRLVVTPLEVYSQGRAGKSEEIVLRASAGGALYRTLVPYAPEYSFMGRIRQALARRIAPRLMGRKTKPLVLYFEKKSDKADESAIHVFERVMERGIQTSVNEFIISSESDAYPELKKKYGKAIVEKYSLHHYVSILMADYFVSSELSNHVISDRVYLNTFSEKIKETPLLFLQHGIMFAKPIDNPQAADFHKANLRVNLQKSVVSSELEAGEFYKVGYTPDDLIVTGLATFDFAKLDPDADRIAYMPTYRYWEEHLVYSGRIEETSYYQDIKRIIETFIEAGLIDRLLIVPHNKFSKYFADAFPEYKGLVDPNPSHALKKSVVFITDYSSAIYDAIIRGAYPIFYWKDRDYLIENYQAIPPVNEFNAPGPAAFSEKELIECVKKALERNCDLEPEYRAKYKAINKFDDGHNTDRIVDYLLKEKII